MDLGNTAKLRTVSFTELAFQDRPSKSPDPQAPRPSADPQCVGKKALPLRQARAGPMLIDRLAAITSRNHAHPPPLGDGGSGRRPPGGDALRRAPEARAAKASQDVRPLVRYLLCRRERSTGR